MQTPLAETHGAKDPRRENKAVQQGGIKKEGDRMVV
jgi:hypothetical protein